MALLTYNRMSTKATLYHDNQTEAFQDCSDNTINLIAEPGVVIGLRASKILGTVTLIWKSASMPSNLIFPLEDIDVIEYDPDGLLIIIQDDSKTGKAIWEKRIDEFEAQN